MPVFGHSISCQGRSRRHVIEILDQTNKDALNKRDPLNTDDVLAFCQEFIKEKRNILLYTLHRGEP